MYHTHLRFFLVRWVFALMARDYLHTPIYPSTYLPTYVGVHTMQSGSSMWRWPFAHGSRSRHPPIWINKERGVRACCAWCRRLLSKIFHYRLQIWFLADRILVIEAFTAAYILKIFRHARECWTYHSVSIIFGWSTGIAWEKMNLMKEQYK